MRHFFRAFFLCASLVSGTALANNCKILVIVGMEDERAIAVSEPIGDTDIEVVVGTADAAILREKLQKQDPAGLKAVFSFGVAGALDPALQSGELLVSEQVLSQIQNVNNIETEISWPVDNNLLLAATLKANKTQLNLRKAIFFGTDTEARNQETHNVTALHSLIGAQLIDNESHIAAQYASEQGLPFLSIRAISDSVYQPLPPAALLPLNPQDGSADMGAIATSLLMNPLQIPALIRTAYHYRQALNALNEFRSKIGFDVLATGQHFTCR